MKKIIKKVLLKYFLFIKCKKYDLIIIDDLLPVPLSPWRNCEFENLIKQYVRSKVISDLSSFHGYKGNKSYNENLLDLNKNYPLLSKKIRPLRIGTSINAKLVYSLFYNNIRRYYPNLRRRKISFGFTLYPGGGFRMGDPQCDKNLEEMINDDLCKFVIVNQNAMFNYLVNNIGIKREKIFLIYGVPISFKENEDLQSNDKKYFNGKKDKVDIVFMSHKYMPFGLDKGFDVFQNTALELIDDFSFDFHVVGNFKETDLLYPELKERIKFYGLIGEESMKDFFENKDIIISPNRPNILGNGYFDGFPLGSSIAGGANNCVMLLTNELNESPEIFIDDIHYVKIKPSQKNIHDKLFKLKNDKEKMKLFAINGRKKILEIYNVHTQINERVKIFNKFL